jgi:hypothetical protein
MRNSRRILTIGATAAAAAGLAATTAGAAGATTTPAYHHRPAQAIGRVELGNPLQYETFRAQQQGLHHGWVNYTNFTYAQSGSGVWAPAAGEHGLAFFYGGQKYGHTLSSDLKMRALSPERLAFAGSGAYDDDAAVTWVIKGEVNRAKLTATITYAGPAAHSYKVFMVGKIGANGGAAGVAKSSTGQILPFKMAKGSFASVLHYVAPVKAAQVQRHDASFTFTIPAKVAGLAGTKVTVKVHDGGWGAKHDTYRHGVTGGSLAKYPIVGGPGVSIVR